MGMIQKMRLLITMDSSTNGRDMVILLRLEPPMTGTVMLVLILPKKPETTLLHTELQRTFNHSGMRTTLWLVPTELSQEMTDHNHSETAQITLPSVTNFTLTNLPTEIKMTIRN